MVLNPGDPVLQGDAALQLTEAATPAAIAGSGKLFTTDANELFFQDGAGGVHLVHGDAFSGLWFHAPAVVEVTIGTEDLMTLINTFLVVGPEDDLGNMVGDFSADTLTVGANGAGVYRVEWHCSLTVAGGANKEMIMAAGRVLNTALVISDVTDNGVSPIVVTSVAHGLNDGDMVEITGVGGNTDANGSFIVTAKADDTFELVALDGSATSGNANYTSGGTVTIVYPGDLLSHRIVSGTDLGVMGQGGDVRLVAGDAISLFVANLVGTQNLSLAQVAIDARRLGD